MRTNLQEGEVACQLQPLSIPYYEGGNLVVYLDEEDYRHGVDELENSVVGRIFLLKEGMPPTTMELKAKLGIGML